MTSAVEASACQSVLGGLGGCEAGVSFENVGRGVEDNVKGQDGTFLEGCCEETGMCEKITSFTVEKYIMTKRFVKEEKVYRKVLCSKQ